MSQLKICLVRAVLKYWWYCGLWNWYRYLIITSCQESIISIQEWFYTPVSNNPAIPQLNTQEQYLNTGDTIGYKIDTSSWLPVVGKVLLTCKHSIMKQVTNVYAWVLCNWYWIIVTSCQESLFEYKTSIEM